jgi:hypothetical protein
VTVIVLVTVRVTESEIVVVRTFVVICVRVKDTVTSLVINIVPVTVLVRVTVVNSVAGVTPIQEHALAYPTDPGHTEAYGGTVRDVVTCCRATMIGSFASSWGMPLVKIAPIEALTVTVAVTVTVTVTVVV